MLERFHPCYLCIQTGWWFQLVFTFNPRMSWYPTVTKQLTNNSTLLNKFGIWRGSTCRPFARLTFAFDLVSTRAVGASIDACALIPGVATWMELAPWFLVKRCEKSMNMSKNITLKWEYGWKQYHNFYLLQEDSGWFSYYENLEVNINIVEVFIDACGQASKIQHPSNHRWIVRFEPSANGKSCSQKKWAAWRKEKPSIRWFRCAAISKTVFFRCTKNDETSTRGI